MVLAKRSYLRELNIPRASSKSDNLCVCPDIDSVVPIIASNSKPSSPEKKINKSGNNRKDYRTNVFVVVSHVWKFTGVVFSFLCLFFRCGSTRCMLAWTPNEGPEENLAYPTDPLPHPLTPPLFLCMGRYWPTKLWLLGNYQQVD